MAIQTAPPATRASPYGPAVIQLFCVTHEMGFAREVADRVIFMDGGQIVVSNTPDEFFRQPRSSRARRFLAQILG